MQRPLNPILSQIMRFYFNHVIVPGKFRIWEMLRVLTSWRPFLIRYGDEGWIIIDERDYIQRHIFANGQYEQEVWDVLSKVITGNEVIWDIGSNIGSFTVLALQNTLVSEVHCFEPQPAVAMILKNNLFLNRGSYKIHKLALSDCVEERILHLDNSNNSGRASLIQNSNNQVVEVKCTTVDELIARDLAPRPTIIKIDVEGWEQQVLEGAVNLLSQFPPKAIAFEADSDDYGNIINFRLSNLLGRYNYEISRIARLDGTIMSKENYIALRI